MSLVLDRLKNEWKKSDFQLSEDHLVGMIPQILEDLSIKLKR